MGMLWFLVKLLLGGGPGRGPTPDDKRLVTCTKKLKPHCMPKCLGCGSTVSHL